MAVGASAYSPWGDATVTTDLRRELASYSATCGRFEVLTVPPMRYLMVDGHGDPNTSTAYQDALATLYPVAYALTFLSKRTLGRAVRITPLEALWWADDMSAFTTARDKAAWSWTLMLLVPDWLGSEHVDAARASVTAKGRAPVMSALRCERLDEGLVVQTLHIGPYDDEGPLLDAMHTEVIPSMGLRVTGRHHEVYLTDARRTAPHRLRTILRQPVAAG